MELVTLQSAGSARSTEPHQPGLIISLTVNNDSNKSNCQLFHSHNVSDFKHSTWINSLTLQQPEEVGTITVTIYDEESELSEIHKCLTICLRSQCQGWCNLTHSVFSKPLTHSLQRSWFCPGQRDSVGCHPAKRKMAALHIGKNDHHKQSNKQQVLERMQRKGNPSALLVAMQKPKPICPKHD